MKIDSEKLIFLHPGKTGGTSVEHYLAKRFFTGLDLNGILSRKEFSLDLMFGFSKQYKIFLQHAALDLYSILGIDMKNYRTVCTVRRPYERILSCFFYNGKHKRNTFEDFVVNKLEKHINESDRLGHFTGHFAPQFVFTKSDVYSVDHIIKLETFKQDCEKVGFDVKFHYSKTEGTQKYNSYMDAYTQKTKDIVYNLYKQDFKEYGYDK